MDYDSIFEDYYTQYRAESTVPTSDDDEYKIGMRYANTAIRRWLNYDNTFWKELFTTFVENDETITISAGTTDYDMPDDMQTIGGFLSILDADNNTVRRYPIIEPQEAQFKGDNQQYVFVTGDPTNGYVMHINPVPDTAIDGLRGNATYYKQPTFFTTGTDVTEMVDPEMIVDRMLYMRFKASRNPYYNDALRDSEDKLKIMQMTNNSGGWSNPWTVPDNSNATFGG